MTENKFGSSCPTVVQIIDKEKWETEEGRQVKIGLKGKKGGCRSPNWVGLKDV